MNNKIKAKWTSEPDIPDIDICSHCKKGIVYFDILKDLMYHLKDKIFDFCFCNFTQSQIKQLTDKNNKL